MQRDAYAALVKKKHKLKIPLRILQLNGEVFHELIFDEVFIGYRNRRLVLMTHMAGSDAKRGPLLPHDVLIADFAKLQQVHHPHFVYQLVPLKCSNLDTFTLLQAVCNSKQSPFSIDHRYDVHGLTTRFGLVSSHREHIKAELLQCPFLSATQLTNIRTGVFPITGVEFDGALVYHGRRWGGSPTTATETTASLSSSVSSLGSHSETSEPAVPSSSPSSSPPAVASGDAVNFVSAAALVTRVDYLSEAELLKRMIMNYYFKSGTYWRLGSNSVLFQLVRDARDKHHIMGVAHPILQSRAELISRARAHQIHLYEKVNDDTYQYVRD